MDIPMEGDAFFMEELEMLIEKVTELISNGEISSLRELFSEMNAVDTALLMDELEAKERLFVFRVLPKDISADVFAYLEPESQEDLVRMINDAELERLLDEMFLDDVVDFLEEVPANVVTRVLAHSDAETRKLINRFLKYPEDSAGSIMTIEMVQLHTSFTAAQAIEQIRKTGVDKETVYTCYCTDKHRHLLGSIPLLSLLLCESMLMAIVVSFMCSLLESALLSLTPSQLADIATKNPKRGELCSRLKDDIEQSLAVILICNTAAHTIGAAIAGAEFSKLFGAGWLGLFTLAFTLAMVQYTEILPKTLEVGS